MDGNCFFSTLDFLKNFRNEVACDVHSCKNIASWIFLNELRIFLPKLWHLFFPFFQHFAFHVLLIHLFSKCVPLRKLLSVYGLYSKQEGTDESVLLKMLFPPHKKHFGEPWSQRDERDNFSQLSNWTCIFLFIKFTFDSFDLNQTLECLMDRNVLGASWEWECVTVFKPNRFDLEEDTF